MITMDNSESYQSDYQYEHSDVSDYLYIHIDCMHAGLLWMLYFFSSVLISKFTFSKNQKPSQNNMIVSNCFDSHQTRLIPGLVWIQAVY